MTSTQPDQAAISDFISALFHDDLGERLVIGRESALVLWRPKEQANGGAVVRWVRNPAKAAEAVAEWAETGSVYYLSLIHISEPTRPY